MADLSRTSLCFLTFASVKAIRHCHLPEAIRRPDYYVACSIRKYVHDCFELLLRLFLDKQEESNLD